MQVGSIFSNHLLGHYLYGLDKIVADKIFPVDIAALIFGRL